MNFVKESELGQLGKSVGIVGKCWVMPLSQSPVHAFTIPDRLAARSFCWLLIAVLAIAIAGTAGDNSDGSNFLKIISALLAVGVSIGLNLFARHLDENSRDQIIIPASGTIIITFIFYILISANFQSIEVSGNIGLDAIWRSLPTDDPTGSAFAREAISVLAATLATALVWVARSVVAGLKPAVNLLPSLVVLVFSAALTLALASLQIVIR
ncbi:MAG: hypothetical protein AAF580_06995 [Pseudomonadota bacterium]